MVAILIEKAENEWYQGTPKRPGAYEHSTVKEIWTHECAAPEPKARARC